MRQRRDKTWVAGLPIITGSLAAAEAPDEGGKGGDDIGVSIFENALREPLAALAAGERLAAVDIFNLLWMFQQPVTFGLVQIVADAIAAARTPHEARRRRQAMHDLERYRCVQGLRRAGTPATEVYAEAAKILKRRRSAAAAKEDAIRRACQRVRRHMRTGEEARYYQLRHEALQHHNAPAQKRVGRLAATEAGNTAAVSGSVTEA